MGQELALGKRYNSPGKRCIRTLTILSTELNTKLQRQTINAQANGPYGSIEQGKATEHKFIKIIQNQENLLTSAKEKQTMKSFSFFGYRRSMTKKIVLA